MLPLVLQFYFYVEFMGNWSFEFVCSNITEKQTGIFPDKSSFEEKDLSSFPQNIHSNLIQLLISLFDFKSLDVNVELNSINY